jgi:hypothetical protein
MLVKKRSILQKNKKIFQYSFIPILCLHLIFISDLSIFLHVHSPLVQSLAAIRPISSQLFAAYPQPPLARITPWVISSTYGAFLSWVCENYNLISKTKRKSFEAFLACKSVLDVKIT